MVHLDALEFHAYSGVIHCSLKEVVLTLHRNALLTDLSDNLKYTQACNRPLTNDFASRGWEKDANYIIRTFTEGSRE